MNIFQKSIPVLAYHQVGANSAITPDIFEEQIRYLSESGYKSVTIDEFYHYITRNVGRIPEKRILITFDDGFADNFIHAYPILKKYGFTAVIFLITSRIKNSDSIRYTVEDFENGLCGADELYITNPSKVANAASVIHGATDDFLSSAEIKKMHDAGVMEFQSHTHTHCRFFVDDNVVDFFNPNSRWTALFETGGDYDYGVPLYSMYSGVCKSRFFDDRGLRERLSGYVKANGREIFFKKLDYKKRLYKILREYKTENKLNERLETKEEYEQRVRDEFTLSKEIIEKITGKKSGFLCWPWGEYSPASVSIAKECGFIGLFTLQRGANVYGSDPFNINRLEVKAKGLSWFKKRVDTYSSGIKSKIYGIVRL